MEAKGRDGTPTGARYDTSAEGRRVAFFGPQGTFTEEALFQLFDKGSCWPLAFPTIEDVLRAVEEGAAEVAVVPIENSIEGTVSATLDHLVFESELLIQAEAILDIHLFLLARRGAALDEVHSVISFPHATAQCRRFIHEKLGDPKIEAANSTADAARLVAEELPSGTAAIAPRLAAEVYGLEVLAEAIEDFPGNQTRFLALAPGSVPAPTGHDKTSIVCFQAEDHPGSLHEVLGQFSARSLNLTKIESRPAKRSLGDYCFSIDFEGHVADQLVADCLTELHASLGGCKFLGSYPAAGESGPSRRQEVSSRRAAARQWLDGLRGFITPPPAA